MANLFAAVAHPVDLNPSVHQEMLEEKRYIKSKILVMAFHVRDLRITIVLDSRFHPFIIGMILVVFLLVTAAFISHMESITYFDAFYACFITYSTIGFGDIDIYVSPI